jgi:hypothetical protein
VRLFEGGVTGLHRTRCSSRAPLGEWVFFGEYLPKSANFAPQVSRMLLIAVRFDERERNGITPYVDSLFAAST